MQVVEQLLKWFTEMSGQYREQEECKFRTILGGMQIQNHSGWTNQMHLESRK